MSDSTNSGINVATADQTLPHVTPKGNTTMGQTLASATSGGNTTSSMGVGSQVPNPSATPVDANHLVGSNQGDHRVPAKDGATGALSAISNAPGPRGETGQSGS